MFWLVMAAFLLVLFVFFYFDFRAAMLTAADLEAHGMSANGHNLFRYGGFFLLGMAFCKLVKAYPQSRQIFSNNYLFVAMVAATVALCFAGYNLMLTYIVVTLPLIVVAVQHSSLGQLLLGNPLMVFLGELSYSIYLSHQLIHLMVLAVAADLKNISPFYEWGATYMLLLVWCFACYHMIELPWRVRLREAWSSESAKQN